MRAASGSQLCSVDADPETFPPAGTAPLFYGVLQDIPAGFSMAVGSWLAGAVAGRSYLHLDGSCLALFQSDLT